MDEQRLDDQLETIYNNSVQIQDVTWRTFRERAMDDRDGWRKRVREIRASSVTS